MEHIYRKLAEETDRLRDNSRCALQEDGRSCRYHGDCDLSLTAAIKIAERLCIGNAAHAIASMESMRKEIALLKNVIAITKKEQGA